MKSPSPFKRLRPIAGVVVLAVVFLWLGLFALGHSTIESMPAPILPPPVLAGPPVSPSSVQPGPDRLESSNPVGTAFINAVPSSDGAEVFISVAGVRSTEAPIILNVDPGAGPGNHQGSYAMTLSGTTYLATAIGFAPGQDVGNDGDDMMSITTTVGSEVKSTGEINFQRAFVETSQPEIISVDDDDFILEILNVGTVPTDTYVLVMSTNTSPGPLPRGCRLVGSGYNVRPSHSLTESEKLMTLNLRFEEPLSSGSDPHTLAVAGCDSYNEPWDILGGDLLDDLDLVTLVTRRFRIYALATTPTWRDSFQEMSLTGVSHQYNTQWGPGQTIVLSSSATSGTVTSVPITAVDAATWSTLYFSATTEPGTAVTVDVLDANDNVVLADVGDGTDLHAAGLDLTTHSSLKLRATLTRLEATDPTPRLHEWQVEWVPQVHEVYLPFVIKKEGQ